MVKCTTPTATRPFAGIAAHLWQSVKARLRREHRRRELARVEAAKLAEARKALQPLLAKDRRVLAEWGRVTAEVEGTLRALADRLGQWTLLARGVPPDLVSELDRVLSEAREMLWAVPEQIERAIRATRELTPLDVERGERPQQIRIWLAGVQDAPARLRELTRQAEELWCRVRGWLNHHGYPGAGTPSADSA